tara:strand:- start:578 stop:868 length:291 start_codon:yes stop_codon:yes gene_type:complete
MNTILIILGLLVVAAGVYYYGFYQQGKINDRDGDYIPDEVEDSVKEVKRRAKRVKQEVKDVVDAAKNVVDQADDVVQAAKGKSRRGRKPRNSKKNK